MSRRQFVLGSTAVLATPYVEKVVRPKGGTWEFEISRVDVALRGLDPAHEGLRVAQLSDLHIGPSTPDGRIIHAVRMLEREGVDLVVLTGDYVTNKGDPLERVQELLTGIHIPAFAVLGNHDHWTAPAYLRQGLERANITVLQNTHTVTRIRGAPLTVLGVDDARSGHADVEATFRGAPTSGSRLVLAHTPITADSLPESQGLLCLSGHTHGGQVYVRGITERVYAALDSPYVRGRYDLRGNVLYVNRGLGYGRGGRKYRIGADPEMSIFTLRRFEA
ncbi:metallophosphoesterase [Pyxidicoccus xibeiensis]|uniref:metallophosphoesterase n=1 Tax=Pyxidicoccus xibeiensis TaxID=2906759 RepID=UPI0020A7060F|nr:metallophosphoesterase [Pyxidicoccus xibeiensis]MCP3135794.1 metallophosphoesterase [Pyxidicoccus xibeiensis]